MGPEPKRDYLNVFGSIRPNQRSIHSSLEVNFEKFQNLRLLFKSNAHHRSNLLYALEQIINLGLDSSQIRTKINHEVKDRIFKKNRTVHTQSSHSVFTLSLHTQSSQSVSTLSLHTQASDSFFTLSLQTQYPSSVFTFSVHAQFSQFTLSVYAQCIKYRLRPPRKRLRIRW